MVSAVLIAGYAILVFMTVLLFSLGFVSTLNQGYVALGALFAAILVALVYTKYGEWFKSLAQEKIAGMSFGTKDFYNFLAVVIGALVAFTLSVNLGLGAVVAAALVAIGAALVIPQYGVPAYCGAFVGMACGQNLFPGHEYVLLASVVAGLVFVAAKAVFNGFGGKLGTIAFTGCVAAALLTGRSFLSDPVPAWDLGMLLIVYSVIGAVLTQVISLRFKHGPVMGSGVVGLLGGLILPAVYPEVGGTLAVMVICASFAGMSSFERIPNEAWMAVAGVFAGLVFMFTAPYLGGAGGKLGTIAFGSVIAVRGMIELGAMARERFLAPQPVSGDAEEVRDSG